METAPGTITVTQPDSEKGKTGPGTLANAEVAELRKIAIPPTWQRYGKSTCIKAKPHATLPVGGCRGYKGCPNEYDRCRFMDQRRNLSQFFQSMRFL